MSDQNSVTRLGDVEYPSAPVAGPRGRPQTHRRLRLLRIAAYVLVLIGIVAGCVQFSERGDLTWADVTAALLVARQLGI